MSETQIALSRQKKYQPNMVKWVEKKFMQNKKVLHTWVT